MNPAPAQCSPILEIPGTAVDKDDPAAAPIAAAQEKPSDRRAG